MTATGAGFRSPELASAVADPAVEVVALQPIGATEQHGPHLPLETDALLAEAFAGAAASALPASMRPWLLPLIAYGRSPEHAGFAGTVSLSSATLLALCLDVARSVAASGVRTLVFVNAHGGNPDLLRAACLDIRAETGVSAYVVHVPGLPLPEAFVAAMPRPEDDVHAGFLETSLMLALHPDSVDRAAARPDGLDAIDALAAGTRRISLFGDVPVPWWTSDLSASGTIGDPTGASAELGLLAFDALVSALAETVVEFAAYRPHIRGTGS